MPTNIVIIGDSNTEGFGLMDTESSYPTLIERYLGPEYKVHNMGISGSCVIHTTVDQQTVGMPYVLQDKYPKALSIDSEYYIINLGTNDGKDSTGEDGSSYVPYQNLIEHIDHFTQDYTRFIRDIRDKHPQAQILLCLPIPVRNCIWPAHKQVYVNQLMPLISAIAKDHDLPIIDLNKVINQLTDIDKYYLSDGLHLNASGHQVVAEALHQVIKSSL